MNDEELDRALREMATPRPSASLQRSIAEIPLRHPRPLRAAEAGWLPQRLAWSFFGAGTFAIALGAFSGIWASDSGLFYSETSQADADTNELSELSELAFADELAGELPP